MTQPTLSHSPSVVTLPAQTPVGGAVIDAQGREIPITERMIQRACRELEKVWCAAPKRA
ncbi:MAG: PA1571 family protein [Pseudomonas sp.]|uniref:PA1571 family protein n=1 Tax=Pseudomonas sp. TaxID=306 RepID=UPI003392F323